MHMNQVHDYARRLYDAHGDQAEVEPRARRRSAISKAARTKPAIGGASKVRSLRCEVRT